MKKDILSVGIDIGTTTTSMIVSRLGISNTAASYRVPEVSITTKDIIYRSPLYLTPQKDRDLLDGEAIRQIVEKEYRAAGIRPEDVDTGAVIITGESSLKENAQIIIDKLSTLAGEFVVATAGPDLESILAGRGSGAEAFSKKYGCVAANLDIGGGTTNVSVFNCGNLEAQTCIDVGGRIAKYDEQGRLTYVSARLNDLGALRGLHWDEGETVSDETLRTIGNLLADAILDSIAPVHTDLTRVSTTSTSKPIRLTDPIQYVSFSGGVADCYYKEERNLRAYHDLGPCIAEALHEKVEAQRAKPDGFEVVEPKETIRATVVGAGTYMTEVSGSTISYSEDLFPIKNLPMFLPSEEAEAALYLGEHRKLADELRWYMDQAQVEQMGLCVRGKERTTYPELKHLAETLLQVDREVLSPAQPLIIICENDLAKALGQVMGRMARTGGVPSPASFGSAGGPASVSTRPIICLDCIRINSGDYIDIGKPVMDGVALPVVVKTLIFS